MEVLLEELAVLTLANESAWWQVQVYDSNINVSDMNLSKVRHGETGHDYKSVNNIDVLKDTLGTRCQVLKTDKFSNGVRYEVELELEPNEVLVTSHFGIYIQNNFISYKSEKWKNDSSIRYSELYS
tara:strand:- start:1147 stop:1524 length:378 start_codon:yes stop_codon:yes gene_type:complete